MDDFECFYRLSFCVFLLVVDSIWGLLVLSISRHDTIRILIPRKIFSGLLDFFLLVWKANFSHQLISNWKTISSALVVFFYQLFCGDEKWWW